MPIDISEEARRPNISTSVFSHMPWAKTVGPGLPRGTTPQGKFIQSLHMNGTPWNCVVYNLCSHTWQPWWPPFSSFA